MGLPDMPVPTEAVQTNSPERPQKTSEPAESLKQQEQAQRARKHADIKVRIHKRLIDITNPTPKTIDALQSLSLPAGCDAEIRM